MTNQSHAYDALLDDHEEDCVLDCGCRLMRPFADRAVGIKFCRLHRTAPAMLLSLSLILDKAKAAIKRAATPEE